MRIIKARKLHQCKKCCLDIWPNADYYPQRRGKAICLSCGKSPKKKTFLIKLLKWLAV